MLEILIKSSIDLIDFYHWDFTQIFEFLVKINGIIDNFHPKSIKSHSEALVHSLMLPLPYLHCF